MSLSVKVDIVLLMLFVAVVCCVRRPFICSYPSFDFLYPLYTSLYWSVRHFVNSAIDWFRFP